MRTAIRASAALLLAVNLGHAAEVIPMYRPELALQTEVVNACRESLAAGAAKRRALKSPQDFAAWRDDVRRTIRAAFPAMLFERPRDLKARVVSTHDFGEYRVENVLFDSLPGWEVNGSVYLPKQPGKYPGVVCPTGHSNKLGQNYQQPAQVFARNGYVAISFDPPGCAGEIAALNDHFTNGLVGYLTGVWSQTHFVADAIACLDYLQTRPDVDQTAGLTATGVSGGGVTSYFAALLDDRVAFCAPSCCLAEHESIHLQGLYTSCPEQFGHGYIAAGIDYADYLSALAPRPCLMLAGAHDEVFDVRSATRVYEDVQRVYRASGAPKDCGLFVDRDSGHAYTVRMANETVRWMNRVIKRSNAEPLPLTDADVPCAPGEMLLCHPSPTANMHTINRDESARLRAQRAAKPADRGEVAAAAARLLGVSLPVTGRTEVLSRRTSWHAFVEEVDVQPTEAVHLPGVMFSHVEDKSPRPALLWLDDQGKWTAFRHGAFLCGPLRMFDADCAPNQPRILSLDVSGLGSLSPEPTAYDLAGWNDIERILTYLSIADARPIMGLRVRDALCGLAYLRSRPDVDPQRLMVGGRGVGALVAMHVALLSEDVRRVICLDSPSHYGALAEQYPFAWPQSVIIPGILRHYDLPELPPLMPATTVTIINPQDAQRSALTQEQAEALYGKCAVVGCGVDGGGAMAEAVGRGW